MKTKKAPAKSKAPAGKKTASKKAGKKSAEASVVEEIPSTTASTEIPVEDEQLARTKSGKRNNDRYKIAGEEQLFGKGRCVQAVVRKYVQQNPRVDYKKLKTVFEDSLLTRFGIFQDENGANNLASAGRQRYFMGDGDGIKLGDKRVVYVCSQFTAKNIIPFLEVVKKLGFKITVNSK